MSRLPVLLLLAGTAPAVARPAVPVRLPVAVALKGTQAALGACEAKDYPVSVVVLDPDGSARMSLRSVDGFGGSLEIVANKAYTVSGPASLPAASA